MTATDWVDADPIFREMRRREAGPPRCADCRHWREAWEGPAGMGWCELVRLTEGTHRDDRAYVSADWDGMLLTRRDFGCVAFEAKERP